jgi:hypothetical protein
MLKDVISHAREGVSKVAGPKAQALFETTAEAAEGPVRAYDHFEQKSEADWR